MPDTGVRSRVMTQEEAEAEGGFLACKLVCSMTLGVPSGAVLGMGLFWAASAAKNFAQCRTAGGPLLEKDSVAELWVWIASAFMVGGFCALKCGLQEMLCGTGKSNSGLSILSTLVAGVAGGVAGLFAGLGVLMADPTRCSNPPSDERVLEAELIGAAGGLVFGLGVMLAASAYQKRRAAGYQSIGDGSAAAEEGAGSSTPGYGAAGQ